MSIHTYTTLTVHMGDGPRTPLFLQASESGSGKVPSAKLREDCEVAIMCCLISSYTSYHGSGASLGGREGCHSD